MAAKLSDTELARRVRERSQQRSIRYRERLSRSGRVQTLVWLPGDLRAQIDALTTERGATLSAVTADLLSAALTTPATPATPAKPRHKAAPGDLPKVTYQRIAQLQKMGCTEAEIAKSLSLSVEKISAAIAKIQPQK